MISRAGLSMTHAILSGRQLTLTTARLSAGWKIGKHVTEAVDHGGSPEARPPGSGTFHAMDPPVFKDPPKRYAAFISYSHSADDAFAPKLQDGLQRLAKPWNQRRALEVFRDQTGLAVTPALWPSICAALDGSRWFVLLSSPKASRSDWVGREIERWVATKGSGSILPVRVIVKVASW